MKTAITIPIYRNVIDNIEQISLERCLEVLGNHKIVFISPKKVDKKNYIRCCMKFNVSPYFEIFPEQYFKSALHYNKLLLSPCFYKRFQNFDFILIYQLDAYVFRDELLLWCSKNYEYIGAPLFEYDKKPIVIGNGGFSLRKPRSAINVLYSFKQLKSRKEIFQNVRKTKNIMNKFLKFCSCVWTYLLKNNSFYLLNNKRQHEDVYWGYYIPKAFSFYNIPNFEEALKFSFEARPSYLYELNNNKLPFGCHAFFKFEKKFWQNHIQFK